MRDGSTPGAKRTLVRERDTVNDGVNVCVVVRDCVIETCCDMVTSSDLDDVRDNEPRVGRTVLEGVAVQALVGEGVSVGVGVRKGVTVGSTGLERVGVTSLEKLSLSVMFSGGVRTREKVSDSDKLLVVVRLHSVVLVPVCVLRVTVSFSEIVMPLLVGADLVSVAKLEMVNETVPVHVSVRVTS